MCMADFTSPLSPDSSFERITAVLRSSSPQQIDVPVVHSKAVEYFRAMFENKRPCDIDPSHLHDAVSVSRTFRLRSVSIHP